MFNLQPGSMLMPEPYSKLPHSPGLVRTPTSDCSTTSVEIYVFFVHFVDQFSVFCSQKCNWQKISMYMIKKNYSAFFYLLSTISGIKGFLEPVKGSHLPAQSNTQDKMSSHQSAHPTHPEIGLPDLSVSLYRTCQMKVLFVMLVFLICSLCTGIWLVQGYFCSFGF